MRFESKFGFGLGEVAEVGDTWAPDPTAPLLSDKLADPIPLELTPPPPSFIFSQ